MPSYVYFIKGGDLVKIGRASNPKERLLQHQCGSPVPLTIVGLIETDSPHQKEAELHRRFAKYRKYLEWFEYSHEIRKYIERKAAITHPVTAHLRSRNPFENELLAAMTPEWQGKTALVYATGRKAYSRNLDKALDSLLNSNLIESRQVKLPHNGQRVIQFRLKQGTS